MIGLDAHLVVARSPEFSLDIQLEIAPGETLAVLGPNGAGKSTTVEALAGLAPLDRGHLQLSGRTLDHPGTDRFVPPEARNIGIVFQDYLLFEHLSVIENVMFGPLARGVKKSVARATAEQWIDALGLATMIARPTGQLSGGEAQRVAMARALANDPDLLLLDEALGALDVATRSELRRVLSKHLRAFEGPRLLITHDPADAFLLADRIAVLEAGRITQVGTSDDIRQRPATAYGAAVAGTNLLRGSNNDGMLTLDDHGHVLQTSDTSVRGPVLITIHPTAIALHTAQPSGSPRNSWRTTVATVEPLGDITRITLAAPLPLGVDITPGAAQALALGAGTPVWASIKATEITIAQAAG